MDAYGRRKAQLDALKADGLVRLADVLEAETKLAEARADQQSAAAALRAAQIEPGRGRRHRLREEAGRASAAPSPAWSPPSASAWATAASPPASRWSGWPGRATPASRPASPGRVDAENAAFELVTSGGGHYPLTFVARAPVVDPRDGTIAVWLVPEKGTKLQPGLTGRVVVTLPGVARAAVVPARAVALADGKTFVVARRDGKPEQGPGGRHRLLRRRGAGERGRRRRGGRRRAAGLAPEVPAGLDPGPSSAGRSATGCWSSAPRWRSWWWAPLVGMFLKFDALPDTTNNQVLVLTRAPGLTPEEVERLVTRPIEVGLGGLPGLVEQRSLSRYGISSVTAVFEDGVDTYRARQMVQERLTGLVLPARRRPRPSSGPVTGGLGEIFHFTLDSPRRSPAELLEIAQFKVAPMLRSVPGVVEVNTWGGEQRVLEVKVDPVRMAARGLTLDDVRDGARAGHRHRAGRVAPGRVRADPAARGGAARGPPATWATRWSSGAAPTRTRCASPTWPRSRMGASTRIGAATENGKGETVYVMAQMLRGENALDVMKRLKKQMVEVRKAVPEDVFVDVVYDRSKLVEGTLRTVFKNLLEGGLLVIAVLFLMLGSWRAGLLVAVRHPALHAGRHRGHGGPRHPRQPHVARRPRLRPHRRRRGGDGGGGLPRRRPLRPTRSATGSAAARSGSRHVEKVTGTVAQPVFFSVLIILLVYVPVLSLTGVDGKMFRPMALTVVFALAASLVLSLTFIPAATALFLRPEGRPGARPRSWSAGSRRATCRCSRASERPPLGGGRRARWCCSWSAGSSSPAPAASSCRSSTRATWWSRPPAPPTSRSRPRSPRPASSRR